MKTNMKIAGAVLAVLAVYSIGVATAGNVTGLTTFTSGSKAVASQVNGNFTAVKTAVDDNNARIAALEARLAAIEANSVLTLDNKVSYSENNGIPEVRFYGVNVKITNGAGQTDSLNGVGNLIIGYDLDGGGNDKTGSHNLVVGNKQSYASYGGFVAGENNTVNAPFASVSGGANNTASNVYASVSGGRFNSATGRFASVSGGGNVDAANGNTAGGDYSSVSGGATNKASYSWASVSGGSYNTASGTASTVSGGESNIASGTHASVSGGVANTAAGYYSSILGGSNQNSGANFSTIPSLTLP